MLAKPPFDDLEKVNELLYLYKNGYTMLRLSSIYGVGVRRIREVINASGATKRTSGVQKQRLSGETIYLILCELSDGVPLNALSRKYTVDRQTIRNQARRHNVQTGSIVPIYIKLGSQLQEVRKEIVRGKYDNINYEKINRGVTYSQYLKQSGQYVYKKPISLSRAELRRIERLEEFNGKSSF